MAVMDANGEFYYCDPPRTPSHFSKMTGVSRGGSNTGINEESERMQRDCQSDFIEGKSYSPQRAERQLLQKQPISILKLSQRPAHRLIELVEMEVSSRQKSYTFK